MTDLRLFAVTPTHPQPLPTPAGANELLDLYQHVQLGVYSVLRTFAHNKFLHLDDHLQRTVESMHLLGWNDPLPLPALRRTLHRVCTEYPAAEMRVRIDVLAAPAKALGSDSRVLVGLAPFRPLPRRCYDEGVTVGFAQGLHRLQPKAKTAAFAVERRRFTTGDEFFEKLLINDYGEILEGVSSNFYAVRAGVLYTAGTDVLEGITRRILLRLAEQECIPVRLMPVPVAEIAQLDEAALSSSSRGLLPIVSIDGQLIGEGRPGPIARRLMARYDTYVAQQIKTALDP